MERALKMGDSTLEYRGNFRITIIILTDASIRHSLNSLLVREPDEYPDGIELQIRTLLQRVFFLLRESPLAFGGWRARREAAW